MTLGATQAYGEPSYWDRRYSQEQGPFDWYQKYSALAPLIDLYISRSHRVLVVGCGNSEKLVGVRCDKPKWELTSPVPLLDEGQSMEEIIGKNPDVHYIYVCTRDESLTHGQIDESVVA